MKIDSLDTFLSTTQYRLFAEFCDACRVRRYIGICTGKPGVGKTTSARHYATWDSIDHLIDKPPTHWQVPTRLGNLHTAIYTPDVSGSVRRVETDIRSLRNRFDSLLERSIQWYQPDPLTMNTRKTYLELLIVDKAHRLRRPCIEAIRDFSEKYKVGVVLVATTGFAKRVCRYPEVSDKIALVHKLGLPKSEELRSLMCSKWPGLSIEDAAVSLIEEHTNANLGRFSTIFMEIERVRTINSVSIITTDLVETAQQGLLFGTKYATTS